MKLQRISEFQHEFSFLSATDNFEAFHARFLESDLGKIHQSIPWSDVVSDLGIEEHPKGSKMLFSPKGRIALMFLKHYACCSDKKLIEQLNGNIDYQFFCDLHLGYQRLTNYKIVSQIRCEISSKLNIDKLENTLFKSWSAYIDCQNQIVVDATCYESELRYPTVQKLLWECVHWLYTQLRKSCKAIGIAMMRTKYRKWKIRYLGFSKMRRKTAKKRRSLTRALLHLLNKLLNFEKELQLQYEFIYPESYHTRISTITKVLEQQIYFFETGVSPKDRIVSIHKDYLRPIVRGKEVKPVEFGAKVNKLQIDGINFIEHLNFNAFNEGTRLTNSVFKAQSLTHKKVKVLGADAIYATNKNRNFVTKEQINTDFKPKGRKPKNYKEVKILKALITKERATRLEGSFGKEKEHYLLKKIKAKTKKNEILWIFCGIHTANALEIGRRIFESENKKAA